MWTFHKSRDDAAEDRSPENYPRQTRPGGPAPSRRHVHWRTLDIATEVFVQLRDRAEAEKAGKTLPPRTSTAGAEATEFILRVGQCDFIQSFRSPESTPLPEPQRPEGVMRTYGFMPLGIANDEQLGGETVYVLVRGRESQVKIPPWLRHEVWDRLVATLGRHLHKGQHVVLIGTDPRVVDRAIEFFYYQVEIKPDDEAALEITSEPMPTENQPDDPPQIKRARYWLRDAINRRASDLHFEPGDGSGRVRFRVDGELVLINDQISPVDMVQVITWIKAQSRMDISERRRPLDGSLRLSHVEANIRRLIDVRVSTIPTIHGQKMVMRLLDPETLRSLAAQGLDQTIWHPEQLRWFTDALSVRDGIVLVTGPTGSGKTTTLNAGLYHLLQRYKDRRNIVTIEDPVEYNVSGVNQIQVNEAAGVTFARTLRSILRQDPDIVLVGEIRDSDTAAVAIQAALTGHLILATLHTNDALGSVERLQDLGISPFLIGSTVRLFQAQRLIRRLCRDCGREKPFDRSELERKVMAGRLAPYRDQILAAAGNIFAPNACPRCEYTGYHGRIAVMEMARTTPELVRGIEQRASAQDLSTMARGGGYRPMVESGVDLLCQGKTSLEEIEALSLYAAVGEGDLAAGSAPDPDAAA